MQQHNEEVVLKLYNHGCQLAAVWFRECRTLNLLCCQ